MSLPQMILRTGWALALIAANALGNPAAAYAELDWQRVTDLTRVVPAQARGSGPVCSDRAAWEAPGMAARLSALTAAASKLLVQNFPEWNDDAYLEYSRKGTRPNGERMMNARKAWLYPLVIAECVEWKGRFLPAIERTLSELDAQATWTWATHDATLRNFRDHRYEVDLLAADTAHELAQTLYMLGPQLGAEVRGKTMEALEARVFAPMRQSFNQGGRDHWWLQADHNWNAVCLKGVVGAALAVLPDARDRAMFVAAGEHYIRKYVAGFPADGYALEGPGYWNYGFSHFTELRELLMQATAATVDLFADARVREVALYAYRIEMLPGNIAAFGDASRNTKMDDFTRAYANQVFALGMPQQLASLPITAVQAPNSAPLVKAVMTLFAQPAAVPEASTPARGNTRIGLQSYFDQVGVLVSRPASSGRLGVSIKSGGNGNHSHNDVGSYAIGLVAEQPTGDVGMTVYSAKTFSKQRYTIKGINSYGHPVPLPAGTLQSEATKVAPRVLTTQFSDAADEITLDIMAAYTEPSMVSLTRRLRHERGRSENVLIEDRFAFRSPQIFETALIAGNNWKDRGDGRIALWQKNEVLQAQVESSAPYELVSEKVDEEGLTFTRIAIRLKDPASEGFVRVRFVPD
ncbi:hypothetical protein VVD49_06310 [Uliginosibacterium sp. H3]|uniref:Heparinase II/III-like protein n=1 Tax=Uliginosibacterium silvisoli TaxID=3114758 RepID=A0ABU6K0L6_9RHOO|nr:hypothetical protein [Uliginosibacterium sp. H3]